MISIPIVQDGHSAFYTFLWHGRRVKSIAEYQLRLPTSSVIYQCLGMGIETCARYLLFIYIQILMRMMDRYWHFDVDRIWLSSSLFFPLGKQQRTGAGPRSSKGDTLWVRIKQVTLSEASASGGQRRGSAPPDDKPVIGSCHGWQLPITLNGKIGLRM